ncbi:alpha/beta fold hydrolase [Candidatus Woesearchaeota archaeon]|nr:alpha/beta fold hydrolase [Candidatus Woesearchaeota archaeon]
MKKILFLHGSAGSRNNFKYLIKELKGYNCISFDLIGYGNEKKPEVIYNVDLFLKFIKEKLNDKKIDYIVGHSMGAILAKEFALNNKIRKVFLINYPMDKEKVKNHWFSGIFIRDSLFSRMLCHTKIIWKYILYPFFFIFNYKYFDSFKDYFKHTNHSEMSSVNNVFMKDNLENLDKIKDKVIFISGEKDHFVIRNVSSKYKEYLIKKMGHSFFCYEKEISKIIKKEIGYR